MSADRFRLGIFLLALVAVAAWCASVADTIYRAPNVPQVGRYQIDRSYLLDTETGMMWRVGGKYRYPTFPNQVLLPPSELDEQVEEYLRSGPTEAPTQPPGAAATGTPTESQDPAGGK